MYSCGEREISWSWTTWWWFWAYNWHWKHGPCPASYDIGSMDEGDVNETGAPALEQENDGQSSCLDSELCYPYWGRWHDSRWFTKVCHVPHVPPARGKCAGGSWREIPSSKQLFSPVLPQSECSNMGKPIPAHKKPWFETGKNPKAFDKGTQSFYSNSVPR